MCAKNDGASKGSVVDREKRSATKLNCVLRVWRALFMLNQSSRILDRYTPNLTQSDPILK